MRKKKIRGHKRIQRKIDGWRLHYTSINVVDYLENSRETLYVKINVDPWNRLSMVNSFIPGPNGKSKNQLINSLIDIYESWKIQLDKSGVSYYLKIWLFDPRFIKSQVVCAIGESIDFYENTFTEPEAEKDINVSVLLFTDKIKKRLDRFRWVRKLDEDVLDNNTVGEPALYSSEKEYQESRKWFDKMMKTPHRIYRVEEPIGDLRELYFFVRGDVWLGERN